jgi:hypothetical protein
MKTLFFSIYKLNLDLQFPDEDVEHFLVCIYWSFATCSIDL